MLYCHDKKIEDCYLHLNHTGLVIAILTQNIFLEQIHFYQLMNYNENQKYTFNLYKKYHIPIPFVHNTEKTVASKILEIEVKRDCLYSNHQNKFQPFLL